jgi:hypothetical protein
MSALPSTTGIHQRGGYVSFVPILLQNSQNAVRSISRKWTKRAAIADRCHLQAITEVACEFIAEHVVPQMIIRSPRVQPGKTVLADAKRLLQQYLPTADMGRRSLSMGGERSAVFLGGTMPEVPRGRLFHCDVSDD